MLAKTTELHEMLGDSFRCRTCADCGRDTVKMGEFYMVRDAVWFAAEIGPSSGMLCIGCLERRLGYKLEAGDFTDCPLNVLPHPWHSKRLRSRLGATRMGD